MKIFQNFFPSFFIVILILIPVLLPSDVFAQSGSGSTSSYIKSTVLGFNINNVAYSKEKRVATIDFTVENTSDQFIDNLEYVFEFNKGEKLAETGLIFRDLDYIISFSDKVEKLSPGETKRVVVTHILPKTIPGGSYFIRGIISNPEISVHAITYKKEPIFLTGLGGFISDARGFFVNLINNRSYRALEGPLIDKTGEYAFEYRREGNGQLFSALEEGEVFIDVKVVSLADQQTAVYEKKKIPLSTLVDDERDSVLIKVEHWENIKPGPYTMIVNFNDEYGEKIAEEGRARFIYRGMFGRVLKLETDINYYKSGDPLNLKANVVLAGDPESKKALLKAYFRYEGDVVREVSREIQLTNGFQGTEASFSFAETKMGRRTWVDQVELVLIDDKGNILDSQITNLSTDKRFAYPEDGNWFKTTLIALLTLVVALVVWAFAKKKINLNWLSIIIAFVLISGSLIVSDINPVLAQSGDEYCQDTTASNYGSPLPCEYGGGSDLCEDYSATNYGSPLPCDYEEEYCTDPYADNYYGSLPCEYGPGYIYGCTDPNAQNFDPFATADDGSCMAAGTPGCMDFTATNYNPSATYDDGTCNYDETGCMDPNASNFNPNATVDDHSSCEYKGCTDPLALNYDPTKTEDDGSCEYGTWSGTNPGDMLTVYHTHESSRTVVDYDAGICTNINKTTQFYVQLVCEACGNAGMNVSVNYFNNDPHPSPYNDGDIVNTQDVGNGHQFYYFLFGPFHFVYVPENFDDEGNIIEILYDEDGTYSQSYSVRASTMFGAEFCKLSDPETGQIYRGVVTSEEIVEEVCDLPSEIRSSFFIDYDSDGDQASDEPYLKSSGNECLGQDGAPLGMINNLNSTTSYSGLSSDYCENNVPYFLVDMLEAGEYQVDIDSDGAFGWIKTGVSYLIDSVWTNANSIAIETKESIWARIGVTLDSDTPVSISCVADPSQTTAYPVEVEWSIPYVFSEIYDREDLTFVWDGVGSLPPPTDVSGGTNNGGYTMYYAQEVTGDSGTFQMSVYAKNSQGETVSNLATCDVVISEPKAYCAAYPTWEALQAGNSSEFFNAEEDVYWRAELQNGEPRLYDWNGDVDDDNQIVGPVSYPESKKGQSINAEVGIYVDGREEPYNASCPIFIRECLVDEECPNGKVCDSVEYICVLPPPIFVSPLTLDPSVINTGEQCRLRWTVDDADSCILYKNGNAIDAEAATSTENTDGINVETGTYTITCQNEEGLSVTGGPVRCLANPDIREQ